jgi:hypothetical protein
MAQPAGKAAGHWQGEIQIPEKPLGITVDLATNASGAWIGSMSVVGSTSIDVPLTEVSVEGAAVRFTAGLPGRTSFVGELSADGSALTGKVANAQGSVPFHVSRSGEAAVKLPPPSTPLTKDFAGDWEGVLEAGGKSLRVDLKLSAGADGKAAGTLVSVDQGNTDIPISTVSINGKELRFESRAVSGKYQGTLGPAGEIDGQWSQSPSQLPLKFKRAPAETKKPGDGM